MRPRRSGLVRASAWNLFGLVVPMVVALASIPLLMRLLGLERFGFLALVWAFVGYASILDLGIGKALIRLMSQRLADGDVPGAVQLASAAIQLLGLLGLAFALVALLAAQAALAAGMPLSGLAATEAHMALAIVAASLPLVLVSSAHVGAMSAWQDFRALNLLRALLSILTYTAPVVLALAGLTDLRWQVASLLAVRLVGAVAYAAVCRHRYGLPVLTLGWTKGAVRELFAVGGWMTVTNVIGALMGYIDRFVVGTLLPLRDVAVYAAPAEVPNRLLVVPYAVLGAIFPKVAGMGLGSLELRTALWTSVRLLCVLMTPIVLIGIGLSVPAMSSWLGGELGPRAAELLQVLLLALWLTSFSMGPSTVIQGAGDPRKLSILLLAELPVLLGLLWLFVTWWGLIGAAAAMALRHGFNAIALLKLAFAATGSPPEPWRGFLLGVVCTIGVFVLAVGGTNWPDAVIRTALCLLLYVIIAWVTQLRPGERTRLLRQLGLVRSPTDAH